MLRSPQNSLVSVVLIAAMAFVSLVSAAGVCEAKGAKCGSRQCRSACCTPSDKAALPCCSAPKISHPCRCSVENERPATPEERQNSGQRNGNEQNDARRAENLAIAAFVGDGESLLQSTADAPLFSFLPTLQRQAVLCRWLT